MAPPDLVQLVLLLEIMLILATGYTGDEYLKDLWAYNSTGDYWEQKADFTGTGRSSASSFALNEKGYVGLGYDGTNKLKDFYQYDPSKQFSWTQKTEFAGTGTLWGSRISGGRESLLWNRV
jgi:N-acetylneuraminic acid mutarotase